MGGSQMAQGQLNQYSFKQLSNKATEAYEVGHYLEAIDYFTKAKELNDDYGPELLYNLGDAAYQVNALALAKENFTEYLKYDDTTHESDALFKLARIDHYSGDYQTAITAYDLYLSEFRDQDTKLTKEADFQRAAAEWATTNTDEDQIESVSRLDDKYNTNASENAPYFYEGHLYYSSQNYPIPKDKLERTKSEILKEAVIMKIPGVKEDQLISNATFTEDGTKMIFTICDYVEYAIICNLYSADLDAMQNISNVTKLPEHINVLGTTTSHPSIVKKGDAYELYFSSNRVGGKGQVDIYKSNVTSNFVYTPPKNVEAINTSGNDLTPHYHGPTETLYFSSDGRNGYGGYDIYKLQEGETPVNLGKTINSAYNDLYFTLGNDEIQAHFTSNRPGSLYAQDKYETCCYDIYSAKSIKCVVDLKTLAFDNKTKENLTGVNIKIVDKVKGTVLYDKTPGSESIITLPCSDKLKLTATREGYEPLEIDLADLADSFGSGVPISKSLYLKPILFNLNLTILEEVSKMSVDGATVYVTDLSTNETQEQTNPGNIFDFSIKPNTGYLVEINKDGFKEKTINFNSGDGSEGIYKEAILDYLDIVAKSIVSLENAIPVSLYFDNDMPDKGTMRTTSTKTYTETFDSYYGKKDKFKNAYLGLFRGSDKLTANDEMEYLFEDNIHKGFKKYDIFKKQLLIVLEAGQDVNVYLRGYASPLAQSEYNTNLGQRRVDSIRKEFDSWNNGVLKPYIQSGQLKVTERSFGETTSPVGISDDPGSPSQSIFSPAASKERRVEIDEINFN